MSGQSTVEFALALPLVAVVMLSALQVVVVMRDSIALTAAARSAARQAMVDPAVEVAAASARRETRLISDRLSVSVTGDTSSGGLMTVTSTYRSPTNLPVVGRFSPDVLLTESFVIRRE